MTSISKQSQCRSNGKAKIKKVKKRNKAITFLNKAWNIQGKAIRQVGYCQGCGKPAGQDVMNAGHLCHGGRGKAYNIVDFNVLLPAINIFCQCSSCNTGRSPDGNGMLKRYFDRVYGCFANELYDKIKSLKQKEWKPTEEEARKVLEKTVRMYGKVLS